MLAIGRIAECVKRRRVSVLGSAAYVAIPAVTTNPYVVCAVFLAGGYTIGVWNVVTVSSANVLVSIRPPRASMFSRECS